ncbi:pyridoxamine 5'-phosphate oxidase family protein [Mycobacterium sp. Lab-001]|uniref:pyridoxamine 5'-phosphate oxidase family protein n=1 Tax=Mycobacterium sp. Lab-001 TaxID=3410136 RepID=UPI003D180EAC
MRTKKKVDLQRLAAALTDYAYAYLITVDDGYHVHTVTVAPTLRDGTFDVGPIGGSTRDNLARRGDVTLLWPPTEPGGYSLIVDGHAQDATPGSASLSVVPDRALLHRDAAPDSPGAAKGVLHDCVVFSLPV